MKFTKTFCKPSSVISVVPAGLPLKLQYDQNGLLQLIRIGFDATLNPMFDEQEFASEKEYNAVFDKVKGFVPNVISAKGGTTWVFGVLYSDNVPLDEGRIPEDLYGSYIADLLKGGRYEFYAGYATSLAIQLAGSMIIRNFLTVNKFDLLPQIVVPVSVKSETFDMLMDPTSYPFNRPFIAGYFIYEDLNCRYAHDTLFQIKVSNEPSVYITEDGCWKAKVVSEKGNAFVFNYSSIIHNNIKKGTILLAEREDINSALKISATRMKTGAQLMPKSSPESIKCPICGKLNLIGQDEAPIQCDDPHCLSHQYQDVQKMLRVFGLAVLSYDEYMDNVRAKDIQCLTDVLLLPQYKDAKISVSLSQALNAIVPVSTVPNSEIFERFANKCNNKVETVNYYLDSPLRIETDLDIVDPIVRKFATWLQDPYNVSTIRTIFDIVEITERKQKFDGDPIFRGNSFVLTGKFRRGDYQEIASIIESYAAKVSPAFEMGEDLPSAVIQGSLNDGISGEVIRKARLHNIPILDEDEFFANYEIDKDLASNLL